jgi:uncharacterized protein
MGLIYLDSRIVTYAFEDDGKRGDRVRGRLARADPGQLAISPLVTTECLVAPMHSSNLVLQRYYEQGLAHLTMLAITDEVGVRAAELRARFALRTADALHLATAQIHGCDALWTYDGRLAAASHDLAVDILKK